VEEERPKKHARQRRWRHNMEFPGHAKQVRALWAFVAAHVEDGQGGKPCPLAMKAWREIPGYARMEYKNRTAAELLPITLPVKIPESLSSGSQVKWNSQ
jgi:hypothetical protein